MVNLDKSEATFSQNVREKVKEMIQNRMRVKRVMSHAKYLSLPIVFGRSKKEVFAMVIERVWKKFKGWKENFLAKVGREVLIKFVAQAILTYIKSYFKLPQTTCKEIETILTKFWWGAKNGERKIHWMRWERLAISKFQGGVGFRFFSDFDTSLPGKQFWCLLVDEHSLVGKVFKSCYYLWSSILEAKPGYSPSYAWRSILSA